MLFEFLNRLKKRLQFTEPLNVNSEPFNRFGRSYEICQWAPSSFNSQTTRCLAVTEQESENEGNKNSDKVRLSRFDFYQTTESHYYAPVALGIWCANWEMGCESLGMKGHFAVLPNNENDKKALLPKYGVSWIVEDRI